MKLCAMTPMMAAGRKAIRMPNTNLRLVGSLGKDVASCHSRAEYTDRIAKIAPSWISTSNVLPVLSNPRK